jgi:hypothetical protein
MRRLGFLLVFGTGFLPLVSAQQAFTYVDLAKRLTDLEHLATLPAPGETTKQWSSYDRASKYDEQTGKYVRWDANGDGGGIIRREGSYSVFASSDWTTWSWLRCGRRTYRFRSPSRSKGTITVSFPWLI